MTCSCAPALLVARDELSVRFPDRARLSDGCCASAKHTQQNPTSDHEPNAQGFARAYDFDEKVGLPGDAPLLPLKALLLADDRTKYVIYERRIAYPDGTDKPYTGTNAHDKHLHLSIKNDAVHDTRPWGITRAFDQEDTFMAALTEDEQRDILTEVRNMSSLLAGPLAGAIGRLDAARAAGVDPKGFAKEVAALIPGLTEDQLEHAFTEVLRKGTGE